MKKLIAFLLIASVVHPAAAETVIKFATLAPEGSTWMKVMHDADKEVQEKTKGEVKFRFYAGGVSGDEKDVVRKIRIGQLHAAGFTGVGLGMIAPAVRIIDSPFLISSTAEADHLTAEFEPEFAKMFEDNGYVLLGWAEVGLVYLFTGKPVRTIADLRSTKMWMWEGDPVAEALFKGLGVSPVPLSVADVRSSLETGLINGVYGSPMAVIALQWYPRTANRNSIPVTDANGAALMSKKVFDGLTKEQQAVVHEVFKRQLRRLTELSRAENVSAIKTLEKNGVKTVEPSDPQILTELKTAGEAGRRELVGKLYDQSLLDRVEKSLAGFRTKGKR